MSQVKGDGGSRIFVEDGFTGGIAETMAHRFPNDAVPQTRLSEKILGFLDVCVPRQHDGTNGHACLAPKVFHKCRKAMPLISPENIDACMSRATFRICTRDFPELVDQRLDLPLQGESVPEDFVCSSGLGKGLGLVFFNPINSLKYSLCCFLRVVMVLVNRQHGIPEVSHNPRIIVADNDGLCRAGLKDASGYYRLIVMFP
jgi:hypothetical protein